MGNNASVTQEEKIEKRFFNKLLKTDVKNWIKEKISSKTFCYFLYDGQSLEMSIKMTGDGRGDNVNSVSVFLKNKEEIDWKAVAMPDLDVEKEILFFFKKIMQYNSEQKELNTKETLKKAINLLK